MATEAPSSIDVSEYQFKLHDRLAIFGPADQLRSNVTLLATSSPFGLLFLGSQTKAEFKVVQLQRIVDAQETGQEVLARVVPLPGVPHNIAVSSDGSLLAVNYTLNGSALLAIYSVPSFMSAGIICKNLIRIAVEDNVQALQILWNPVIAATFALVLSNGSLSVYNLKDAAFEFHSVDKQEQAKCACWSPKGKQIVVGFPAGKLTQYKPDLKLARTILCPPGIHEGPFDTIAVQWLSTYQFAVVFLQHGEDRSPALHIVNAPKVGSPTYINYYDICYSSSGPRAAQIFLTHIQPWNIILMASSNSIEVGILGTTEAGESPLWKQYITPDEARIELPLTKDKQETHPIGFAFETGTTHQLTIAETKIPVMPMIHILSTQGLLVSFDFLNFSPNSPGICSPPQPIADMSGVGFFQPINSASEQPTVQQQSVQQQAETKPIGQLNQQHDVSFALNSDATSTPAQERKTKPIFGNISTGGGSLFGNLAASGTTTPSLFAVNAPIKPIATAPGLFGSQVSAQSTPGAAPLSFGGGQPLGQKSTPTMPFAAKPTFGASAFGQSLGTAANEPAKALSFGTAKENITPAVAPNSSIGFGGVPEQNQVKVGSSSDKTKPLYTVPPTYTASQQQAIKREDLKPKTSDQIISSEDSEILKESIGEQIMTFERELRDLSKRSKDVDITIGNMEESKDCVKKINQLQELIDQALESTESLSSDVQALRHSLNECFVMIAETKSKLNMFNNPNLPQLATMSNSNQTNRRQLIKLKSMVATNEAQLQIVNQQIDAQWSNYQDLCRKSRTKMRIPSLEGVYQTLSKEKDILARERLRLDYLKSKLGMKSLAEQKANKKNELNIQSLADSILSMRLSEDVKIERSFFTDEKLQALRNILQSRKIIEIKPHRPDRIGVNSDVIQEVRIRSAKQREGATTKPEKMEKQRIKNGTQHIAKPTPTKPIAMSAIHSGAIPQPSKSQSKVPLVPKTTAFNSGIVKPTATTQPSKETAFTQLTKSSSSFSFGNTLQPKTSASASIPFGGSSIGAPAQLSFGTPTATASPNQMPFGTGINKDDKEIVKSTPAPLSVLSSKSENTANETAQTFSLQPKQTAMSTAVDDGLSGGSSQPKNAFFGSKIEGTPSSFIAPVKPAIVVAVPETRPIEPGFEAIKAEKDAKTTTPFTAVSLSQSSAFGAALNFNLDSTSKAEAKPTSDTTTIGSIFGGQTTISKHTSMFGTSGQTVSSSEQPQVAANSTGFSTPAAAVFTPLSLAAETTPIPVAPAVSSPSFLSMQSKPSVESVVPSATVEPAQTTPVATGFEIATTATAPPLGFGLGAATTFSFAGFPKTTAPPVSSDSVVPVMPRTAADSGDSLFGSLTICKPTAIEALPAPATSAANAFAGSIFNMSSFDNAASVPDVKSIFGASPPATTAASVFSTTGSTPPVSAFGSVAPVVTTVSVFSSEAATVPTAATLFGSTTITPAPPTSTSSIFAAAVISSPSPAAATSTFGVLTSTAAPTTASSGFGTSNPAFGTAPVISTGNVFGGIPKPDQSVFGMAQSLASTATTNSPFGGIVTPSTSPFNTPPSAQQTSGGNLFGSGSGGTVGFGMQPNSGAAGSIFGGASPSVPQQTNVFGSANNNAQSIFATQKTDSANVFGSQSQPNQTANTTNFFGSSTFGDGGQTTGSIFGGGNTTPAQSGAFSTPAFGQSPFGNVQQQQAQQQQQAASPFSAPNNSSFGGFGGGSAFGQSTGFNAAAPGAGGPFAQVGQPSVIQSGFGSPNAPGFGSPPTFGSSTTFGGAPTFGGGATFGSPKSTFSSFAAQTAPALSPPTQNNNLFETLGSTDAGLSFSNLAQNTNNAAAKQQFGGSSFSSWR